MRANVSVLHPEVSVPASCLPFSTIPPPYLDWYRAVFEEGKRLPPPESAQLSLSLATSSARPHAESCHFEVTEGLEFDSEIIWHDGPVTITQKSVYFDGKRYQKPQFDVKVATTPRQRHLIAAFMDGTRPRFHNLTLDQDLSPCIEGEDVMLYNGQFYIKQHENILAVDFIELPGNCLLGVKVAANVMLKSTRMFEGLAIQNLLGGFYASVLPSRGVCHQVRLNELDGYQIIDARLYNNVLMVIAAKGGSYDKLVFRFADNFSSYDLRLVPDVSSININFTVLDSGVVLHMTDEDNLEVFLRLKDSSNIKAIRDPSIEGDVRLFHTGSQALVARGNKLYRIRMRQQQDACGKTNERR
jgi:hypothetical protein